MVDETKRDDGEDDVVLRLDFFDVDDDDITGGKTNDLLIYTQRTAERLGLVRGRRQENNIVLTLSILVLSSSSAQSSSSSSTHNSSLAKPSVKKSAKKTCWFYLSRTKLS